MITLRELDYVNVWARKVPYPGIGYAERAAEKLVEAFESYNEFYKGKRYDIITSAGEQIEFEILSKNLCHMLGIDYKSLSGEYNEDVRKELLGFDIVPRSYDLIASIVENIDELLKYDCDNNGKLLNYYRIMIKCSIFEKLSDFSRFNFGVINFDKDIYMKNSGVNFSGNSEKILYVQSNEVAAPVFMMGILPEENSTSALGGKSFAVETLMAPTNVKDYFNMQEVAIPTQILISTSDEMKKIEATAAEKIFLLNQYRSIIREYGLSNYLNVYGDYEAILVEQTQNKTKKRVK